MTIVYKIVLRISPLPKTELDQMITSSRIVLRITPPENSKSLYPLSMKYGCHISKVKPLLEKAKSLELNVIGVR